MKIAIRTTGTLILLLGIAIAAFAAWGWLSAETMNSNEHVGQLEATQWPTHWKFWSTVTLAMGLLTAFAGLAIAVGRMWGFLLVSLVAGFAAAFPWGLQVFGWAKYAFEVPSAYETWFCLAVLVCALMAYLSHSGNVKA